ncbi:MAG: hypothetical protein P4L22_03450 [Candidatus Babeliales bacterium]|nr:hypothetical protein [Candidatus Babeliales bacterium]
MNKIFLSLIFICSILYGDAPISDMKNDPLLVVVIMVKDEESVIVPTLEPFVKSGIDSFFVYDTGSTDKTMANAQDFFEKNKIANAYITQEPFIDFATSRNRALDLAKEKFPNSVFTIMPDAEWYLQNGVELVNFCKQNIHDFNNLYLIRLNNNTDDFYHGRLLRTKANLRFAGVVHEVIASPSMTKIPVSVCFDYRPRSTGIEASAKRWKRDSELLLREVQKNPQDSRSAFYLAQTYECLHDLHNAYKYYEIRSKLPGWDEENYETYYRMAGLCNTLSDFDPKFTKAMAHDYYMKAYNMRPHRAEPLIKIAEMHWPSNYALCFRYARLALELPYPKDEVLFVNKEIYEFTRYEVLSKVAWYMGEFELGEHATRKAIEAKPNLIYLYNNLKLYMDKKNKYLLDELTKAELTKLSFPVMPNHA